MFCASGIVVFSHVSHQCQHLGLTLAMDFTLIFRGPELKDGGLSLFALHQTEVDFQANSITADETSLVELLGEIGKSVIMVKGFNKLLSFINRTSRQKISQNIVDLSNSINHLS